MILCKGKPDIPNDIQGLEIFSYKNSPDECGKQIKTFVSTVISTFQKTSKISQVLEGDMNAPVGVPRFLPPPPHAHYGEQIQQGPSPPKNI